MTDTTLRKTILLQAEPAQVWEYLTDPDKIATWFHKPQAALALGETYEMLGKDSGEVFMSGKVLVAEPHTRLEYEFHLVPMGNTQSHVAWTLEAVEGGTRLSLVHSGLPQAAMGLAFGLDKGWDGHLGQMRDDISPAD
ncbi:MAG: SRPBCC family protein [Planktomarina sp.]